MRTKMIPGTKIPKIIWSFWRSHDPEVKSLPRTVEMCVQSWIHYNPDYEVRVLDMNTMDYWVPEYNLKSLKYAADFNFVRLADFLRICLLKKYGGIWMDATNLATCSFDEWYLSLYAKKDTEFVGFYIGLLTRKNKKYPVIENWFLSSIKGSKFVSLWASEFLSINNYDTVEEYVDEKLKEGLDLQHIEEYDDPYYLTMHVAAQVVLQLDKYPVNKLCLLEAADGPLKYIAYNNWEFKIRATKALTNLCRYDLWSYPFVKITGDHRHVLENNDRLFKCFVRLYQEHLIK